MLLLIAYDLWPTHCSCGDGRSRPSMRPRFIGPLALALVCTELSHVAVRSGIKTGAILGIS